MFRRVAQTTVGARCAGAAAPTAITTVAVGQSPLVQQQHEYASSGNGSKRSGSGDGGRSDRRPPTRSANNANNNSKSNATRSTSNHRGGGGSGRSPSSHHRHHHHSSGKKPTHAVAAVDPNDWTATLMKKDISSSSAAADNTNNSDAHGGHKKNNHLHQQSSSSSVKASSDGNKSHHHPKLNSNAKTGRNSGNAVSSSSSSSPQSTGSSGGGGGGGGGGHPQQQQYHADLANLCRAWQFSCLAPVTTDMVVVAAADEQQSHNNTSVVAKNDETLQLIRQGCNGHDAKVKVLPSRSAIHGAIEFLQASIDNHHRAANAASRRATAAEKGTTTTTTAASDASAESTPAAEPSSNTAPSSSAAILSPKELTKREGQIALATLRAAVVYELPLVTVTPALKWLRTNYQRLSDEDTAMAYHDFMYLSRRVRVEGSRTSSAASHHYEKHLALTRERKEKENNNNGAEASEDKMTKKKKKNGARLILGNKSNSSGGDAMTIAVETLLAAKEPPAYFADRVLFESVFNSLGMQFETISGMITPISRLAIAYRGFTSKEFPTKRLVSLITNDYRQGAYLLPLSKAGGGNASAATIGSDPQRQMAVLYMLTAISTWPHYGFLGEADGGRVMNQIHDAITSRFVVANANATSQRDKKHQQPHDGSDTAAPNSSQEGEADNSNSSHPPHNSHLALSLVLDASEITTASRVLGYSRGPQTAIQHFMLQGPFIKRIVNTAVCGLPEAVLSPCSTLAAANQVELMDLLEKYVGNVQNGGKGESADDATCESSLAGCGSELAGAASLPFPEMGTFARLSRESATVAARNILCLTDPSLRIRELILETVVKNCQRIDSLELQVWSVAFDSQRRFPELGESVVDNLLALKKEALAQEAAAAARLQLEEEEAKKARFEQAENVGSSLVTLAESSPSKTDVASASADANRHEDETNTINSVDSLNLLINLQHSARIAEIVALFGHAAIAECQSPSTFLPNVGVILSIVIRVAFGQTTASTSSSSAADGSEQQCIRKSSVLISDAVKIAERAIRSDCAAATPSSSAAWKNSSSSSTENGLVKEEEDEKKSGMGKSATDSSSAGARETFHIGATFKLLRSLADRLEVSKLPPLKTADLCVVLTVIVELYEHAAKGLRTLEEAREKQQQQQRRTMHGGAADSVSSDCYASFSHDELCAIVSQSTTLVNTLVAEVIRRMGKPALSISRCAVALRVPLKPSLRDDFVSYLISSMARPVSTAVILKEILKALFADDHKFVAGTSSSSPSTSAATSSNEAVARRALKLIAADNSGVRDNMVLIARLVAVLTRTGISNVSAFDFSTALFGSPSEGVACLKSLHRLLKVYTANASVDSLFEPTIMYKFCKSYFDFLATVESISLGYRVAPESMIVAPSATSPSTDSSSPSLATALNASEPFWGALNESHVLLENRTPTYSLSSAATAAIDADVGGGCSTTAARSPPVVPLDSALPRSVHVSVTLLHIDRAECSAYYNAKSLFGTTIDVAQPTLNGGGGGGGEDSATTATTHAAAVQRRGEPFVAPWHVEEALAVLLQSRSTIPMSCIGFIRRVVNYCMSYDRDEVVAKFAAQRLEEMKERGGGGGSDVGSEEPFLFESTFGKEAIGGDAVAHVLKNFPEAVPKRLTSHFVAAFKASVLTYQDLSPRNIQIIIDATLPAGLPLLLLALEAARADTSLVLQTVASDKCTPAVRSLVLRVWGAAPARFIHQQQFSGVVVGSSGGVNSNPSSSSSSSAILASEMIDPTTAAQLTEVARGVDKQGAMQILRNHQIVLAMPSAVVAMLWERSEGAFIISDAASDPTDAASTKNAESSTSEETNEEAAVTEDTDVSSSKNKNKKSKHSSDSTTATITEVKTTTKSSSSASAPSSDDAALLLQPETLLVIAVKVPSLAPLITDILRNRSVSFVSLLAALNQRVPMAFVDVALDQLLTNVSSSSFDEDHAADVEGEGDSNAVAEADTLSSSSVPQMIAKPPPAAESPIGFSREMMATFANAVRFASYLTKAYIVPASVPPSAAAASFAKFATNAANANNPNYKGGGAAKRAAATAAATGSGGGNVATAAAPLPLAASDSVFSPLSVETYDRVVTLLVGAARIKVQNTQLREAAMAKRIETLAAAAVPATTTDPHSSSSSANASSASVKNGKHNNSNANDLPHLISPHDVEKFLGVCGQIYVLMQGRIKKANEEIALCTEVIRQEKVKMRLLDRQQQQQSNNASPNDASPFLEDGSTSSSPSEVAAAAASSSSSSSSAATNVTTVGASAKSADEIERRLAIIENTREELKTIYETIRAIRQILPSFVRLKTDTSVKLEKTLSAIPPSLRPLAIEAVVGDAVLEKFEFFDPLEGVVDEKGEVIPPPAVPEVAEATTDAAASQATASAEDSAIAEEGEEADALSASGGKKASKGKKNSKKKGENNKKNAKKPVKEESTESTTAEGGENAAEDTTTSSAPARPPAAPRSLKFAQLFSYIQVLEKHNVYYEPFQDAIVTFVERGLETMSVVDGLRNADGTLPPTVAAAVRPMGLAMGADRTSKSASTASSSDETTTDEERKSSGGGASGDEPNPSTSTSAAASSDASVSDSSAADIGAVVPPSPAVIVAGAGNPLDNAITLLKHSLKGGTVADGTIERLTSLLVDFVPLDTSRVDHLMRLLQCYAESPMVFAQHQIVVQALLSVEDAETEISATDFSRVVATMSRMKSLHLHRSSINNLLESIFSAADSHSQTVILKALSHDEMIITDNVEMMLECASQSIEYYTGDDIENVASALIQLSQFVEFSDIEPFIEQLCSRILALMSSAKKSTLVRMLHMLTHFKLQDVAVIEAIYASLEEKMPRLDVNQLLTILRSMVDLEMPPREVLILLVVKRLEGFVEGMSPQNVVQCLSLMVDLNVTFLPATNALFLRANDCKEQIRQQKQLQQMMERASEEYIIEAPPYVTRHFLKKQKERMRLQALLEIHLERKAKMRRQLEENGGKYIPDPEDEEEEDDDVEEEDDHHDEIAASHDETAGGAAADDHHHHHSVVDVADEAPCNTSETIPDDE